MAKPIRGSWSDEEKRLLVAGRELNLSFEEIVERYIPRRTAVAAEAQWTAMRKGYTSFSTYHASDTPISTAELTTFREMAAQGSRELLEAYNRYFEKHVRNRGTTPRARFASEREAKKARAA